MLSLTNSIFVLAAALVVTVSAQSGTGTSSLAVPTGLDSCIITCVTSAAASAGCSSFSDLECVCTSSSFQSTATSCLQANCTASDLQEALALQQEECLAVIGSSSAIGSTTGTASTASATSNTSSASSTNHSNTSTTVPTATSSSGTPTTSSAAANKVIFGYASIISVIMAIMGVMIGGSLIV